MGYARTAALLALLTALFAGVGYLLGGTSGAMIAFVIAVAMNFFAYWNSDQMALRAHRAEPVPRQSAPELHAMLAAAGFGPIDLFGSFEAETYTPVQRLRASLRRMVTASGIFQRWPQARELLKPLVYRDAAPLSYDLCRGAAPLPPLVRIDRQSPNPEYKVIYALAHNAAMKRET